MKFGSSFELLRARFFFNPFTSMNALSSSSKPLMSRIWPSATASLNDDPSELALLTELSLVLAIVADLILSESFGGYLVSSSGSESELETVCCMACWLLIRSIFFWMSIACCSLSTDLWLLRFTSSKSWEIVLTSSSALTLVSSFGNRLA